MRVFGRMAFGCRSRFGAKVLKSEADEIQKGVPLRLADLHSDYLTTEETNLYVISYRHLDQENAKFVWSRVGYTVESVCGTACMPWFRPRYTKAGSG